MKTNQFFPKPARLITIILLFFAPFFVVAQEVLTGLPFNVSVYKAAKSAKNGEKSAIEAVKLPFKEDFSHGIGFPNPQLWKDRQGFVNQSFALQPPTIGVVTLDAIDENGRIYAHAENEAFGADTLTSNPIRLDSIFTNPKRPLKLRDSLYFSFYYQPGGGTLPHNGNFLEWERIGDAPETDDSLVLEFGYETGDTIFLNRYTYGDVYLDRDYVPGDTLINPFIPDMIYIFDHFADSASRLVLPADSVFGPEVIWNHIWATAGQNLDDWLRADSLRTFKQVMIPIVDEQYLRNNFQFRFRNYASLEDNGIVGWASNVDFWHIDYVYLGINRTAADTFPNDVAFVMPSMPLLRQYQAMPWWQFRQTELRANFNNQLSNLSNSIKNTNYTYSVQKVGGGEIKNYTSNNENANPYFPNGLHAYAPHVTPAIDFQLPTDAADSAIFVVTHIFQEEGGGDSHLPNDTCIFEQKFANFYAYDDGVAENGYSILSTLSRPEAALAVRFSLNQPDTLRAVQIWFNPVLNDANEEPFTLMVWADNNGEPGEILYSKPAQLPAQGADYQDFITYFVDDTLLIDGTFYVGFMQQHAVQLNVGFDCNNDARAHFMYRTASDWRAPFLKGAPMIRPLLGKYIAHSDDEDVAIANQPEATAFSIFPNPTADIIFVSLNDFHGEKCTMEIYDIFGKLIDNQIVTDKLTAINVSDLASGTYIIYVSSAKKHFGTQKFIKQ